MIHNYEMIWVLPLPLEIITNCKRLTILRFAYRAICSLGLFEKKKKNLKRKPRRAHGCWRRCMNSPSWMHIFFFFFIFKPISNSCTSMQCLYCIYTKWWYVMYCIYFNWRIEIATAHTVDVYSMAVWRVSFNLHKCLMYVHFLCAFLIAYENCAVSTRRRMGKQQQAIIIIYSIWKCALTKQT